MIVIALLAPEFLLLALFALEAFENALFPPPRSSEPKNDTPEQSPNQTPGQPFP